MIFHGMKILQKSWSCKDGTPLNRSPKKELAKIGMWVVQSHYSMKMASSLSCFCFVSFYLCFCFVLVLLFLFWFVFVSVSVSVCFCSIIVSVVPLVGTSACWGGRNERGWTILCRDK